MDIIPEQMAIVSLVSGNVMMTKTVEQQNVEDQYVVGGEMEYATLIPCVHGIEKIRTME